MSSCRALVESRPYSSNPATIALCCLICCWLLAMCFSICASCVNRTARSMISVLTWRQSEAQGAVSPRDLAESLAISAQRLQTDTATTLVCCGNVTLADNSRDSPALMLVPWLLDARLQGRDPASEARLS